MTKCLLILKGLTMLLLAQVHGSIAHALPEAFEEKALSFYAGSDGEAYRVAIEPFGGYPQLVRIVRRQGQATLFTKQLGGEGLYYLGRPVATTSRTLSEAEWLRFKAIVYSASFWSKKSRVVEPGMVDGAFFWIDGFRAGKSLALKRHCVGALPHDQKLAEMATFFLRHSRTVPVLRLDPFYSKPIITKDGRSIILGGSTSRKIK